MSTEGRHAGGWDAPVGNLAVCLAGNRMRKQMEDRGGFTASWCRSAVGQPHLPWMRRSDPGGADRGANRWPLGAQGCPTHIQASELRPKFNESRRFLKREGRVKG